MCNLYRLHSSTGEIAHLFAAHRFAVSAHDGVNHAALIYPGYTGLVVAEGAVRAMTWGVPLMLRSKRTGLPLKPKPINNAREDKLSTAFWRDSFVHRRCLIPLSQWAEAEGTRGQMTRTWYGLPGHETFAVAGIWRRTAEWGDAYSMVMVDGCEQMAPVHDRMPLILDCADRARWVHAPAQEALALCRVWTQPLTVERSGQPWFQR